MARKYIIENQKPALIEFMTYRRGDHSTSDNSSLYRKDKEVSFWKTNDPIMRLAKYLDYRGWKKLDMQEEKETRKKNRDHVVNNLKMAEDLELPAVSTIFEQVYDKMTDNLKSQQLDLNEHLEEFGHLYPSYLRSEKK
jgi:2-oxoisovalerate dehydrogenase E1 component alpha subunit